MVMQRASELVNAGTDQTYQSELSPYEVLLLLLSTHFHDVGNLYGRDGHEQRIMEVMEKVPAMGTFPLTEKRIIASIASTHGGRVEKSKDTIGKTLPGEPQTFSGIQYRAQLIAAILRLAD